MGNGNSQLGCPGVRFDPMLCGLLCFVVTVVARAEALDKRKRVSFNKASKQAVQFKTYGLEQAMAQVREIQRCQSVGS